MICEIENYVLCDIFASNDWRVITDGALSRISGSFSLWTYFQLHKKPTPFLMVMKKTNLVFNGYENNKSLRK